MTNSTSGELVLKFTSLIQTSPSSITAESGIADLHHPSKAKADLKISSLSGEVYSDFDIELTK